ncbi:uncharacterized protein CC84DRAFT_1090023 [Paraphaeosphaeria sporulosa]|uniref:Tat pathway signal sequence n=1 Tax=Paraphaeosphaeria sporulosa TaxID=1460663 RepID=A0A177CLB9_9PLEO|nr:uncharacterized protein CC84DRAFT_1090023 [Paraphaeosphaeria sporulosa]OAG07619.1 hypothetical protein CC84DRAFT_1090023 [Paraphaeosphaeria sporulosa]
MFLSSLVWTARHISSPNYLLKKTNTYTPLLDRFDISFVKTKNNASLFNTPYSIYKDDPSPSVDAAWEEIADTPVLAISREDVVTMGKDPDYVVGIPEEFGHGPGKYFAVNDGQHLIHCLNELRKYAFYDYYYAPKYGPETNLPKMVAAHRTHCVGVLLDALTCQPSLNMVVWEYVQGQSKPWPDFDAWRMCYGHEKFYEWQKGEQVDLERTKTWDWTKARIKERPEVEEMRAERRKGGESQHEGHWA